MDTMTVHVLGVMWLLSAVASGQNQNVTGGMTTASSANPLSETPPSDVTQPIIYKVNSSEAQTATSFVPNTQTAATPISSITFPPESSTAAPKSTTEIQTTATTSAKTVTYGNTGTETSTSLSTSDTRNIASTHQPASTNVISTTTASTKFVSASPNTGHDATQSTGSHKTTRASTVPPFPATTEAKKTPDPQHKNTREMKHGKVVAGIIGGALALMMVGFLIIYIKKRKLQRQQISTTEWAGPSPFLEGGANNGGVALRSSNRVSLSSFLPQRLSRRLSLLPETDELELMAPGTTFGDKNQNLSAFGQKVDGDETQKSNGTAVVAPETKSTGDATLGTDGNSSLQTNGQPSTDKKSESANPVQDNPANTPTPSEGVENTAVQLKDDSEEA